MVPSVILPAIVAILGYGAPGTAAVPLPTAGTEGGIFFVDTAATWKIDFHHRHGGQGDYYMIETMGSGVVAFDYDGDGDDDLLFVDSGQPAPYGGSSGRTSLLRNDLADGGKFVDVTDASGIHLDSYGMGAVAGDVDGDGDQDLYLTAFGPNRLFLNNGDGAFRAATSGEDAADPSWSASAAFGDLDLDGDLDLYVTNYVDFSYDDNKLCGEPKHGIRSYCHPDVYNGLPDRLYVNQYVQLGRPVLVDATREFGLADARGAGLGVVLTDLDQNHRPDIYVANDMDPNLHFVNREADGGFGFVNNALLAGTALSTRGEPEAGMGIAVGDVDGNGFDDLIVTHLDRQTNALYSNRGAGLFLDRRFAAGIAEPSLPRVGFGAALADMDLDGDLDLVVANGHVSHAVADQEDHEGATFAQPNQLFENVSGRFNQVEKSGIAAVRTSRGLVVADFDLDGDLDLVISNNDDLAEVYRNESSARGDTLKVDLLDRSAPNRHSVGAVIELLADSGAQRREVRAGASYLSQHSLTQTFALPRSGASSGRDPGSKVELRVHWNTGRRLVLPGLRMGRRLQVVR